MILNCVGICAFYSQWERRLKATKQFVFHYTHCYSILFIHFDRSFVLFSIWCVFFLTPISKCQINCETKEKYNENTMTITEIQRAPRKKRTHTQTHAPIEWKAICINGEFNKPETSTTPALCRKTFRRTKIARKRIIHEKCFIDEVTQELWTWFALDNQMGLSAVCMLICLFSVFDFFFLSCAKMT